MFHIPKIGIISEEAQQVLKTLAGSHRQFSEVNNAALELGQIIHKDASGALRQYGSKLENVRIASDTLRRHGNAAEIALDIQARVKSLSGDLDKGAKYVILEKKFKDLASEQLNIGVLIEKHGLTPSNAVNKLHSELKALQEELDITFVPVGGNDGYYRLGSNAEVNTAFKTKIVDMLNHIKPDLGVGSVGHRIAQIESPLEGILAVSNSHIPNKVKTL